VGKLDLGKYQPMIRLLDREDLAFLKSQPGYRPKIGRSLKRARRRVFRMYLASMGAEFRTLHREARRMVAGAAAEHEKLVGVLIRQRVTFWCVRSMVEVRLALHWLDFGDVDVGPLVELLEEMRLQLQPPRISVAEV
jgi:hypothetical protein